MLHTRERILVPLPAEDAARVLSMTIICEVYRPGQALAEHPSQESFPFESSSNILEVFGGDGEGAEPFGLFGLPINSSRIQQRAVIVK